MRMRDRNGVDLILWGAMRCDYVAGMEDQPGEKEKAAALRALSARWPAYEAAMRLADALVTWTEGGTHPVTCAISCFAGSECGACSSCAVNAAYRAYLAARA